MPEMTSSPRERLILPFLAPFYHHIAQPFGWLTFRVFLGGMLMMAGWPKIMAPFAMSGFAESLGFAPGWLFSPIIAGVEFLGGLFIIIGFLTRPSALAATFLLLVTLSVHVSSPYGDAFLTEEGIIFLQENAQYLTEAGQRRLLPDGGAGFLASAQGKAETNSMFWALGVALIAAFGGGRLSVDRLLRREF